MFNAVHWNENIIQSLRIPNLNNPEFDPELRLLQLWMRNDEKLEELLIVLPSGDGIGDNTLNASSLKAFGFL